MNRLSTTPVGLGLLLSTLLAFNTVCLAAGPAMETCRPTISGAEVLLNLAVQGAETNSGSIRIGVYGDAATFARPGKAICRLILPVADAAMVTIALPPGWYAIAAGHDANSNGKIDRSLLPTEAYGFSNYEAPPLGRPDFSRARFKLSDSKQRITVRLGFHPLVGNRAVEEASDNGS